jgi:hypothetical protein
MKYSMEEKLDVLVRISGCSKDAILEWLVVKASKTGWPPEKTVRILLQSTPARHDGAWNRILRRSREAVRQERSGLR